MRTYVLLALLLVFPVPCQAQFQGTNINGWTMKKGTSKTELVIEKDGKEKRIKWEDMKESQLQNIAKVFAESDKLQFEEVQPHLSKLQDNPKVVAEVLKHLHNKGNISPYAGLWAAVVESAGMNDIKEAEKLLLDVKRRIEIQRVVDPKVHRQTMVSVLNNLAVVEIKQGNGNTAAGYLAAAIAANRSTSPLFAKNINQLLAFPEGAKVAPNRDSRSKLTKVLAQFNMTSIDTQTQNGWHYSLDFDIPDGVVAARHVAGIEPPVAGLELESIGTGIVLANGFVVTAKENVAPNNRARLVTVAYPTSSGTWDSKVAKNILVESATYVAESVGVHTTKIGNVQIEQVWTKFKVIPPDPGVIAAETAALHVGSLPIKPAMVSAEVPDVGEQLRLKNYPRATDSLSPELISSNGVTTTNGRIIEMNGIVDGGALGAPVFNEQGAVVGLVYDYGDQNTAKAFNIAEVRDWFRRHVKTAELKVDDGSAAKLADNAIVVVMSWVEKERTLFSTVTDASKVSGQLFYIDRWCLSCDGHGAAKCPTCKGIGTVAERRQEVIGQNQTFGTIVGDRQYNHRCPNCNGARFMKCPYCNAGVLNLGN